MKTSPITIKRQQFGGRDPGRRRKCDGYNEAVHLVEAHIARRMAELAEGDMEEFLHVEVANAVRLEPQLVQDIMFSIDCGHNGTRIIRGKSA
jgi:hypothetical protein